MQITRTSSLEWVEDFLPWYRGMIDTCSDCEQRSSVVTVGARRVCFGCYEPGVYLIQNSKILSGPYTKEYYPHLLALYTKMNENAGGLPKKEQARK